MPDPIKKPKTPLARRPVITLSKKEVDAATVNAKNAIAKKMGITADKLPVDVLTGIDTAVKSALDTRVHYLIQRDADKAVKDTVLVGAKPIEMLDSRIAAALEGVRFVTGDAKVDAVLNETAKLLWKKYQALISVGFSTTQAYDLLLAEVAGKSSRNR